jgi:hypothetical protein
MIPSRRHLAGGFSMFATFPVGPVRIAALLVVAAVAATARPSAAQSTAEPDPTGGLRSRGMVPGVKDSSAGSSRDELVRQWDLDGNGTIDESEASVARARMRRSRMQLKLDSGLDPVTGKPRVIADSEPTNEERPAEADTHLDMPPEPRKRSSDNSALPGTRVPDSKPVISGTSSPSVPKVPEQAAGGPDKQPATMRPSLAPSRPGSVNGGGRAGAPGARPGYGSSTPKPTLNAGIPLPNTSGPTGSRVGAPRGGLLPSTRLPLAPRPTTPTTPTPRPPRVTADDIGGF